MTKERKVPVTPAESYPLGHAKENKDASAYTGFKYPSGGGNDIGVYKQPMTNPNSADILFKPNPNTSMSVSIGDRGAERINPHGVGEMRGYGAATKGRKISGKQG
jgi:hypothetical protein